jgi:hypothetical protein
MDKINEISNLLIEKIKEEWVLAGHSLTGEFEASLEAEIKNDNLGVVIYIWGNEYGIYRSTGVPAENIPYTRRKRGQGSGGTSKYLTGLKNWVQQRLGISDEREALSIAFSIANSHLENGILGSGFLDEVSKKYDDQIEEKIADMLDKSIEKQL